MKVSKPNNMTDLEKIKQLRTKVDLLDKQMIKYLALRFLVTQKIGQLKARANVGVVNKARQSKQLKEIKKLAKQHQLNPQLTANILKLIIDEAVRKQRKSKR